MLIRITVILQMPYLSWSPGSPSRDWDPSGKSSSSWESCDTYTSSCYFQAFPSVRRGAHHDYHWASDMIEEGWLDLGIPRCSTSRTGKMLSNRRKVCIHRVHRAFYGPRAIAVFPCPNIMSELARPKKRWYTHTSADGVSRWRYGLMDLYCL